MRVDPDQLDALAAIIAEGTFEGAARRLHVTQSAISQRIKALESTTGQVLLARRRPVRPTAAGEVLLRLASQLDALSRQAEQELGVAAAAPVLPIATNADSLATWLAPALAAAQRALAGPIAFDLRREDQDQTVDLLRRGEVMAAITSVQRPVSGCTSARLGRMRYRPAASPAFARRWFADGPHPAALAAAPVIVFDRADDLQDRFVRRRARRRLDPPRHHVPDSWAFIEAVRQGLGWGMVPDLQRAVYPAGALVDLEPDRAFDVPLYWQQWRVSAAALDAVAAAVHAAAADVLR